MKQKTKKVLLPILSGIVGVSAIALLSTVVGNIAQAETGKTNVVWSDVSLESEYGFGAEFSVPQRRITVDGVSVEASATLEFPKGSATTLENVTLSEGGKYSINYYATVNGNTYVSTETFQVSNRIGDYGENSSISYGKHELAVEAEGLLIRLAENDDFTFSTVIDLNGITKSDVIIEGFVTPDRAGTFDFEELFFTFTDVVDSSKTLTIRGRQYALGAQLPYTYWQVGGENQILTGYEQSSGGIHRGNRWGTPIVHSFAARDFDFNGAGLLHPDKANFRLTFDTATMSAYVNDTFIADLDDPKYYDNLWTGFASGRVKLTVHGNMYSAATANFCLTKVKGIDLTAQKTADTKAPQLSIDVPYETMPKAKIGGWYPVPNATAHDDMDGVCEVTTSVWYNYASENSVLIPVVNGRFATSKRGNYVIEYVTEDSFGNKAIETLIVKATNDVGNLVVENDEDNIVTEGLCGYPIRIPAPIVSGGSGDTEYSFLVTLDGELIEVKDGCLTAQKTGVYSVTYYVSDYIGQKAGGGYKIRVESGNKPIFTDLPVLPHIFISGSTYQLPIAYFNDYSSGSLVKREATITVVDASGERNVLAGTDFIPTVNNYGDIVKVIYSYGNAKEEFKIPAVTVWETIAGRKVLNLQKYLYLDGVSYIVNDDYTEIVADGLKEMEGWTYANKLVAKTFSLDLVFANEKLSKCGSLDIILKDYVNAENSLTIRLKSNSGKVTIAVGVVEKNLELNKQKSFSISYTKDVIVVNGTSFEIKTWDNGRNFDGFVSDFITVSTMINAPVKGASYQLVAISGQPINIAKADFNAPTIFVTGNYGGTMDINETVTLPRAVVGDVLDPNAELTLTVLDPNGKVVSDINGMPLQNVSGWNEYQIKVTEYGQYNVIYTATDTFRANSRPYSYTITVTDEINPTLKWTSNISTTAKVGDVIVMPNFYYADNMTEADELIVLKYVLNPNGRLVTLDGNSNSIRCGYAGVYEFRVIVMDKAGNTAMIRYQVTVS